MNTAKTTTLSALALAGLLALTACGGAASPTAEKTSASSPASSSSAASPDASTSASASEGSASEAAAAGSGKYKAAPWAKPINDKGTKLGTIKSESISIDVYQVATDVASKDSNFLDKETKKNLLPKGAPIVYMNYVVTNTSSEDLAFTIGLVSLDTKYADWKYLGGMPSDSSSKQYEKHGLDDSAQKLDKDRDDKAPYILAAGESYNVAENFAYTAGKELLIKARISPRDAAGERIDSKREEAEGSVTLK
ncbi:hypothetical protein BIU82_03660 [Arthrobacter sp. SW1]|uniref:hypothetical protein n=1 Tax=Arthrobacter sp. SW1 TaxID=1920889 RepID=UPI000877DCD0|nr:hypothetical protein [Arthrobacter sp. SW1]OFI38433.1 hypothetical protein BIU82_03660 [Arthrobacter sp. SW1]